jgi:hypothetical protein
VLRQSRQQARPQRLLPPPSSIAISFSF